MDPADGPLGPDHADGRVKLKLVAKDKATAKFQIGRSSPAELHHAQHFNWEMRYLQGLYHWRRCIHICAVVFKAYPGHMHCSHVHMCVMWVQASRGEDLPLPLVQLQVALSRPGL